MKIGDSACELVPLRSFIWYWKRSTGPGCIAACGKRWPFVSSILNHGVVLGLSDTGSSCLGVDGTQFRITRGCTYINVAMTVAPFFWRFQNGLDRNLLWLLLVFAAHFRLSEWTWSAAHDWPNQILRWSIVVSAVWLALRADRSPPHSRKQ